MLEMKDSTKTAPMLKYGKLSRRSFLKGALAVGGALALAGCGPSEPETQINTVTVTDVKTVTVTSKQTVTVTEPAPTVPTVTEIVNMVTVPSVIIPRYTICDGCNLCMTACSFEHGFNGDIGFSNIQVYGIDIKGGMVDIPILCMKCNDTPCLASCPPRVDAISVDEVTGAVKIDHDKCTVCGNCVTACDDRTGILHLSRNEDYVVGSCDMCEGNPACVKICPPDALHLINKTMRGETFALKPWPLAEQVWNTLYR